MSAAIAIVTSLVIAAIAFFVRWVPPRLTDVHMRSVAKSLSGWGDEYSRIKDEQDATRATEMLNYIRSYYRPGEGYRGTARVEAQVERARSDAVHRIEEALQNYKRMASKTNGVSQRDPTSRPN